MGRSVHPAFQRKVMASGNPDAQPRSSVVHAELPVEPSLPPVHITQVMTVVLTHCHGLSTGYSPCAYHLALASAAVEGSCLP